MDTINNEINNLKKDLIKSLTMYTLTNDTTENKNAVLNSVLISWLDGINSPLEFREKHEALNNLINLESVSLLFQLVLDIDISNDSDEVKRAMVLYKKIIDDNEYKTLSDKCDFHLSTDYLNEEKYYDSSLVKNIDFLCAIDTALEEIEFHKKRGF